VVEARREEAERAVRSWEDVLDDLVRHRGGALVRYATLLTGDRRAAEDLVQDALVKSFGTGRPLRDELAAEAYVRRAILTVFLDGTRRRRRWSGVAHLLVLDDEGPDHAAGDRIDVRRAIATLPPRLRACVVLRFYDDLTVPQIARDLDLAEGSVKRYLSDATQQLEALLGPLEDAGETEDVRLVEGRKRWR
jgi:RNA polymerase sigma-70 factor (ECF subfamily)